MGEEREEGLDYQGDIWIDKFSLDEECRDQPRRFSHWAQLHVESIAERDRVKRRLLVIQAEVELEVRSFFANKISQRGITKGTEAEFKAVVELDLRVQEGENQLLEANRRVNLLAVAREAFQDRKKQLEQLVHLWLSMYWADPKLPRRDPFRKEEAEMERAQLEYLQLNKS